MNDEVNMKNVIENQEAKQANDSQKWADFEPDWS